MRKCLVEEFSDLYVFHLRGNQRTSGELSRREGGKIFGSGSRAPIAISVFIKNPDATESGRIHFHDIGDYLDQKQKLNMVREFGSIEGITTSQGWRRINPDHNNDWLDQVDRSFERFIQIGSKDRSNTASVIFSNYSRGAETGRDVWSYQSSISKLKLNMRQLIEFYNEQVKTVAESNAGGGKSEISYNEKRISWTSSLLTSLKRAQYIQPRDDSVVPSVYRPFQKQHLYFHPKLIHRVGQLPQIFPNSQARNLVIMIKSRWGGTGQLALMMDVIPELQTDGGSQCFPLHLYESAPPEGGLFSIGEGAGTELIRRDAITDAGHAHFQAAYPDQRITKEDLFYYIYGLLHSPDYRARFKNNLAKQLPRIPAVKTFTDFAAFRDAGRALGDLHVNFETVDPFMVTFKEGDHRLIPDAQSNPDKFYRVRKMRFAGRGKDRDRSTVIYNDNITMQNIPLAAYDYVINGKPALEWVMERQVVTTHKASGITNDANDYANETVGDPRYPLELFQRVITVSLETMRIVDGLPELEIE